MTITKKVQIEQSKLEKEIQTARKAYERRPHRWAGNEGLGRILYLMNDPAANEYLQRAAEYRDPSLLGEGLPGWELIAIGNYYRMMNNHEKAQEYFQKAYRDQKGKAGMLHIPENINFHEVQRFITICFFMKRYDEACFSTIILSKTQI